MKKIKNKKKIYIVSIFLLIILVFLIIAKLKRSNLEIDTSDIAYVSVESIKKSDIYNKRSIVGKIEASDTYYVMPKTAGEIIEIYVKNGDKLKKDDPIAKIDNEKQRDASKYRYEQAKSNEESISASFNRISVLYAAGDVSRQEYEQMKSRAEVASSQLKAAKLDYDTNIEYGTVISPADGIVQNTDMTIDSMVNMQSVICILSSSDSKIVKFSVPENILSYISMGDLIEIEKDSRKYKGEINKISGIADERSGLFDIEASIDAENLPEGINVKLSLVGEHRENTYTLPLDSLYFSNNRAYVYIYKDGILEKREVKIGIEDEEKAEILEGIDEDELVISTWTSELYDGAKVNLREEIEIATDNNIKNSIGDSKE